jgi:hypothetical protein
MPEGVTDADRGPLGFLIDEWRAARSELAEIERAEHLRHLLHDMVRDGVLVADDSATRHFAIA